MNKLRQLAFILLLTAFLAPAAHADVVVTDTTHSRAHWGTGVADTPIGTLFYFLGDVVSFPFDLLGGLF
ncbi:MAG TPA: hypothetical protein VL688_11490 [Verrucomicrobiae bacterium]|jgi:hypothetical protein|nr:hypothetical protein [Verrucomicrobiae bacterium]